MKRREFIKNTGTASLAVPLTLNGLKLSAIPELPLLNAAVAANDRVLVIVQLLGGNDGLNTVVPIDQYENLQKARPNVILPANSLLNLTPTVGFHPVMTGLKSIFDAANLGIVQSVGYPNQNRSHFRSVDIWRTGADATQILTTGWAGRYFDTVYPGYPIGYPNSTESSPIAIAMGSFVSETCQGKIANYSLAINDPFNFSQVYAGSASPVPAGKYGLELEFLREAIQNSNAYATGVNLAAKLGKNIATYPDTDLAHQLKNVALMISGGMKTKVYVVTQDFFDTHAKQVQPGNTTIGTHANLLKTVSDAINAFQLDLRAQSLEKRVIGVSLSEFGRQIKSNASLGTDHGTAAPLFLFGACVKPQILGANPVIGSEIADQEGVPMEYDFRNVYGSILQDWFGADISTVKEIFYPEFNHMDLIAPECRIIPASTSTDTTATAARITKEVRDTKNLTLFPNPTSSYSTCTYMVTKEEYVQIGLYDVNGNPLKILNNRVLPAGMHQFKIDLISFAAGYYFVRIVTKKNGTEAKGIIKL